MLLIALVMQTAMPQYTMPSIGQLPQGCVQQDQLVSGKPPVAGPRKLNEMPNAEAEFAVVRKIDGCPIPVKVNAPRPRPRHVIR